MTTGGHIEAKPVGIHRKLKGTLPMTLYLFKVDSEMIANSIINREILIDGKPQKIRKYLDSEIFRCTKCQGLGHLSKKCTNAKKCVRCAGPNCEYRNCKNKTRKCANCHEEHSAAFKNCPAQVQKRKTSFKNNLARSTRENFASQQKQQMADISQFRKDTLQITENQDQIRALFLEVSKLKEKMVDQESEIGKLEVGILYLVAQSKHVKDLGGLEALGLGYLTEGKDARKPNQVEIPKVLAITDGEDDDKENDPDYEVKDDEVDDVDDSMTEDSMTDDSMTMTDDSRTDDDLLNEESKGVSECQLVRTAPSK